MPNQHSRFSNLNSAYGQHTNVAHNMIPRNTISSPNPPTRPPNPSPNPHRPSNHPPNPPPRPPNPHRPSNHPHYNTLHPFYGNNVNNYIYHSYIPYDYDIEYSIYRDPAIQIYPEEVNIQTPVLYMEHEHISQLSTTSNPNVWGPSMWFTFHNCAAKYPVAASPIYKSKMRGLILAIPYMLPCVTCQVHANNYIEKYKNNLDDICSGREKLFNFFVDFHNSVNKRYNKRELTYEEASKLYNENTIVKMNYK